MLAHDLHEPLRMIVNRLQLLGKRYRGKVDGDADEIMSSALDGALRVERVIDDLLTYSRFASSRTEPERMDANMALRRALAALKLSIDHAGAVVTCDPLPTVDGDAGEIEHLFRNLVSNAIKFRGAERPSVHVAASRENGEWVFTVRDNGIGIEPRYFDRLFIPFQRLHGGHDYPGAGIGLAIARKIAERHGGRIWVESRPGEGSTFLFTLPVNGSS